MAVERSITMYSNAFDSVRIEEEDQIKMEGLLYTSILNGKRPTFTLNQVIDSIALQNIVKNNVPDNIIDPHPFLYFFENGTIRVARHKDYYDKDNQKMDPITGYLVDALMPVEDRIRNPYCFSSLPFLYNEYEDKQIQIIYDEMLKIITGDHSSFDMRSARNAGIESNSDHMYKIDEFLQYVFTIKNAVKGYYIPPAKQKSNKTLSDHIMESIHFYETDEIKSCFHEGLGYLRILIEKERERTNLANINRRSVIYGFIKEIGCDESMDRELKALVDVCYNEVVADSIEDDEKSIFTNSINCDNVQRYLGTDNTEPTALGLIDRAQKYDSNHLTWDTLHQIIGSVRAERSNQEKWLCEVEEYCRQAKLNNLSLSKKAIFKGVISFPIMVHTYAEAVNDILPVFEREGINWATIVGAIIMIGRATIENAPYIDLIAKATDDILTARERNQEIFKVETLLLNSEK